MLINTILKSKLILNFPMNYMVNKCNETFFFNNDFTFELTGR